MRRDIKASIYSNPNQIIQTVCRTSRYVPRTSQISPLIKGDLLGTCWVGLLRRETIAEGLALPHNCVNMPVVVVSGL